MTTWQRYLALAVSLMVLGIVVTVTTAGSAIAQGPLRPVEALIVNTSSNPVPVQTATPTAITDGGSASSSATCNSVGGAGGQQSPRPRYRFTWTSG